MISRGNKFVKIIDENLIGTEQYNKLIREECLIWK